MNVLPPDKHHPPRPDWTVVRNLTFTEIHAFELGLYLGAFLYAGTFFGATGVVFPVIAAAIRRVISEKRAAGEGTCCEHPVGLHDARLEPHYFGTGAVVAYAVLAVILL